MLFCVSVFVSVFKNVVCDCCGVMFFVLVSVLSCFVVIDVSGMLLCLSVMLSVLMCVVLIVLYCVDCFDV